MAEKFGQFHKSTYSGGAGEACIEQGLGDAGSVGVRDSKRADSPVLAFSPAAWSQFVTDAQGATV